MELQKILVVENEMEAQIMKTILEDKDIPFVIHSYYDKAYNGIFTMQKGWGHIESEPKYKDQIIDIYNEVQDEITED